MVVQPSRALRSGMETNHTTVVTVPGDSGLESQSDRDVEIADVQETVLIRFDRLLYLILFSQLFHTVLMTYPDGIRIRGQRPSTSINILINGQPVLLRVSSLLYVLTTFTLRTK